jgi:hypothetical protein
VAQGLAFRDGAGHRGSPHRYWSPALEAKWQADPQQAETDEALRKLMEGWQRPGGSGASGK